MKVYISLNKSHGEHIYHTNQDCHTLNSARNVQPKQLDTLPAGASECTYCEGSYEHGSPDRSYHNALKREAAKDD